MKLHFCQSLTFPMAPGLGLLLSFLLLLFAAAAATPSPYLSGTTLRRDYHNMLTTFKIFIYNNLPPNPYNFQDSPAASLFYNSLLHSPFITDDPDQAHLFFLPFSPDTSTRSLGRVVRQIRNAHPYWNRTLGADHFFLSPSGIDYSSDRNVLELKKNGVQISVFPVTSGLFIPHKDITLPPFINKTSYTSPENPSSTSLAYLNWDGKTEPSEVNAMKSKLDTEFLVLERPEQSDHVTSMAKSKFCLFLYHGDVSTMVEAMGKGCVPVLIVDRPIQDLPLMDVLRWSDMAMLVRGSQGALKVLSGGMSEEKYAEMRELCVASSRHLRWNEEAEPMDAFHMVMYQLWKRRHVVRYSRRREYI